MKQALLAAVVAVGMVAGAKVAHAAQSCGITPVMLVIQDRSGSMADPPDSTTSSTKWSIASSVVPGVLSNYSSGFDYGLMLFPGSPSTDVCSAGVTTLGVGSSVSDIQSSYQASGPAGATPMATTLLAARDYLTSLNLSVPAYVLLITDGQPNCNGSLDGYSCTCTKSTYGCDPSSGGTAYNCLDDSRTEDAAAQVRAAGFPVYVVGFGTSSTVDNNGAVLDAIAASGGTNHSYSALNTSDLQNALNQIVGGVTGCCTDTCTPGTYSCSASGAMTKCEVQASGCYDWSVYPCASGSTCQSGSCQACNATCTAGDSTCNGNTVSVCVADANGCTSWQTGTSCASGSLCQGGACQSCSSTCTAGASRCLDDTTSQLCVADASGCTSWQDQPCGSGDTCSSGICSSCSGCTVGDTQCNGSDILVCTADAQGCTSWQPSTSCGSSELCVDGACVDCSGACTLGATQCDASGDVQTCVSQAGACNTWAPLASCGAGDVCLNGACCTPQCTPGATRCGADGSLQTCDGTSGCAQWVGAACASGQTCADGQCLQPCNGGSELNDCPSGYVCTTTSSGKFCEQSGGTTTGSSGGTSGSTTGTSGGGSSGSTGATDATTGGSSGTPVQRTGGDVKASGCACGSVPASELGLALPFVLVLFSRRRRR